VDALKKLAVTVAGATSFRDRGPENVRQIRRISRFFAVHERANLAWELVYDDNVIVYV
jgi:hypothetical protein